MGGCSGIGHVEHITKPQSVTGIIQQGDTSAASADIPAHPVVP